MVPWKNDKEWKTKTWEDVVCVDVRYKDRDKTIPEVNIWRRTQSGRTRTIDPVEFPSYFYIPATDIDTIDTMEKSLQPISIEYPEHKTIDGESAIKLVFGPMSKAQFSSARVCFKKTYESDVKYRLRYHIDNNIKFTTERRICFFDIETDMSIDIKGTPAPVTAISAYDTETKEMMTLLLDKSIKQRFETERADHNIIIKCAKETDLLQAFVNYIKLHNPDILTAFNLNEFDFPYLINRMKVLDIKYRDMSEIGDVYAIVDDKDQEATRCRCGGRELLDYYILVKKLYDEDKPETWKLDDVANKIIGHVKTKHEYKNLRELYEQDKKLFVEYNQQDVRLIVEIENKTGFILKYLVSLQQLVPMPLEVLKDNSVVVDCYILKTYNKKVIFPSKVFVEDVDEGKKSKFKGAITGRFIEDKYGNITSTDPLKKMYSNVGVFDFSGLYPNIIRTFNISPETICIPGEPDSASIEGVGFTFSRPGLLPALISNVIELRKKYQTILDALSPDDPRYPIYYNMQYAVKRLNNSIYGVSGYSKFRLYNIDVAKSITGRGQEIIKDAYKTLTHTLGYEVIYSDTDSCFFVLKSDVNDREAFEKELEYLERKINERVVELVNSTGAPVNYLHMDFEKRLTKVIFMGVKKRYIFKSDYWKGKWLEKPKVGIKGFDLVRGTMAASVKVIIRKILMNILDGEPDEETRVYYKEAIAHLKTLPYAELAWKVGLGKNIDDYDKVIPSHIKACICAKQHLGIEFRKNDAPKIMYVKNLPYEHEAKLLYSDVIAFEKDTVLPPHIINKLDYERYIQSFVVDKLKPFLGCEGIDMEYILGTKVMTLSNFFNIRDEILGEVR